MNEPRPERNQENKEFDELKINSSDRYEVIITEKLDPSIVEPLYGILSAGFEDLNDLSIEKQDMTFDEFKADALDESVLKFVIRDKEKEGDVPVGCLFIHTDPKRVTWIPRDFYQDKHPELYDSNHLLYTSTLVIGRESRDLSAGRRLIKAAQRYGFDSSKQVMFMDYSDHNSKVLPGLFEYCAKKIDKDDIELRIEQIQIGIENYYLLEPQATSEKKPIYHATELPLDEHTIEECILLFRADAKNRFPFDERLTEEELEGLLRTEGATKITVFEGGKLIAFSVLSDSLSEQHINSGFVEDKSDKGLHYSSIYTSQESPIIYQAVANFLLQRNADLIIKLDEKNVKSQENLAACLGYSHIPEPIDRQHFLAYIPSEHKEVGE